MKKETVKQIYDKFKLGWVSTKSKMIDKLEKLQYTAQT